MTEPKPQRKGRDFVIGFLGSILLVTTTSILAGITSSFLKGAMVDIIGITIYIAGIILVVVVPIITFICHRKFIGFGILTALVAVPLLLIGSCFALSSFSH
jgi:hypothetical protein